MEGHLTITTRAAGRRQPLIPDWQFPLPPNFDDGGEPETLRNLITRIVLHEVEKFRDRQAADRLTRVLTTQQIESGLGRGKIKSGQQELNQQVDEHHAVGAALEAFEDGIYLVFIDGEEQRDLDKEVHVKPGSELRFIRAFSI